MNVFLIDAHAGHAPTHDAIGGEVTPAREVPARVDAMLGALQAGGHAVDDPGVELAAFLEGCGRPRGR